MLKGGDKFLPGPVPHEEAEHPPKVLLKHGAARLPEVIQSVNSGIEFIDNEIPFLALTGHYHPIRPLPLK